MVAVGRGNADFSSTTRRLLGSRAGWICSAPGCLKGTLGPGDAASEHADVGIAAHIRSAALKGPRGRGTLSDEVLAHPDNGIWCCAIHGREIDTNSGRGYPVETLIQWKSVREDAARRERAGFTTHSGWISEIKIVDSPLFKHDSVLQLGKATVVFGEHPAGRSALLEWLAAVDGIDALIRWRSIKPTSPTRLEIRYDAKGHRHRLEFGFNGHEVNYTHDDRILHSPPGDLAIVHMREEAGRYYPELDDIEVLSKQLGLDVQTLRNLTREIARNGPTNLRKVDFIEEDPTEWRMPSDREKMFTALTIQIERRRAYFRSLSSSEAQRVMIEFACAQAREKARSVPTVLLLDGGGWSLDDAHLADTATWLLAQPFQTVLVTNSARSLGSHEIWKSWSLAVIDLKPGEDRAFISS